MTDSPRTPDPSKRKSLGPSLAALVQRKSAYVLSTRQNGTSERKKIVFNKRDLSTILEYAAETPKDLLIWGSVSGSINDESVKDEYWIPLCHRLYPSSKELIKENGKFACLQMNNYIISQIRQGSVTKKKHKGPMEYKIAYVGGKQVGKSALTVQLLQGRFIEDYEAKIEDVTITQEAYLKQAHGFLLVYNVLDWASFDKIIHFYDKIRRVKEQDWVPIVLVANKSDQDGPKYPPVPIELGKDLARKLKIGFIETSAKDRVNIEETVIMLVRLISKQVRIYYRECWESISMGKPISTGSNSKKCILM